MAQAADYFLAAMDRYEEARNRKQEMAMQQEQHALYMKNGLMQLDQLQQKVSAGDEFLALVRDPAMASQATTQQPQQQPLAEGTPAPSPTPGFDSSALHKTLSQMSGYMNEFNGARGNSGFGTTLSMHPQQDGSYIIGAANPEQGGAYPLTVNPQDNSSAPLRVAPETVGPMQQYVQGRIDATGGDPAKMAALAKDQFGLRHDEQGNIFVPRPELASLPEEPAPASTAPAAPTPGTKTKTTVPVPVSTKIRFNKDTVHYPVKFYEAAADPNLRPDARDRKVLQQIDMDHTYAMGIPLHLRGKVAALGLKAGYFNGDQALNMAQTGFSNMNSMELDQALTALKMNKVQFRKAELDFTNALKYDARLKQAQLDNYAWATKASQARITASTETANAMRSNRLGAANDRAMKLTGEAIDRYGLQNNIDPEKMKQLKAELQPSMVAAISSKYGGQISTVMNDGKTPLALQQLADQVLAAQLDPNKKQQPSAYSTTQDLLDGKGVPTPETRATVMGSLPKNQEGNIKENAGTFNFLKEMAAGTADRMKLKDGDKGAFVDKAATDLMTIMPMLGLRGQDLQGSAASNYGFVASVIGAYGRMKQTPETRMYGDENLMMLAVTNKLSGVPADVEAQQARDVMLRLEVLGKGNNYYHQLVTKLSEQDHVPNKDLYKTALGQLDAEVESMGKAQEVAARSAAERAQKVQAQQPWSPQPTLDASQFWK